MRFRRVRSIPLLAVFAALTACGGRAADSTLIRESFDSGDTYSRTVPGPPAQACEAARRTLLSQGYAIARAGDDAVEGNKNFQPKDDEHEQLVLRISCAPRGDQALVFVSAVQAATFYRRFFERLQQYLPAAAVPEPSPAAAPATAPAAAVEPTPATVVSDTPASLR